MYLFRIVSVRLQTKEDNNSLQLRYVFYIQERERETVRLHLCIKERIHITKDGYCFNAT